jgi:hypothetical protein
MSTLYVAHFPIPQNNLFNGHIGFQAPQAPPISEQTVAIGGSPTQSTQFPAGTQTIRVHTDSICSIAVGNSPTATTSNMRMIAGQTEYFVVNPGDKIAVITNT